MVQQTPEELYKELELAQLSISKVINGGQDLWHTDFFSHLAKASNHLQIAKSEMVIIIQKGRKEYEKLLKHRKMIVGELEVNKIKREINLQEVK
jgi:hypothetical protein